MSNSNVYSGVPEVWGGIECTINRVKDVFNDQLEHADFYQQQFIDPIINLGIQKVRFPVLWERHQPVADQPIDWSWTQNQLTKFEAAGVDVIAGLIHHGSGPSYTDLLDENFPFLLAQYAKKVAEQFPTLKYYTPVNEPLTTARFSGLYGFWYPHAKTDRQFLLMLLNQLKAVVLSMQEIRKINPAAVLVQTEDLGKTYSTKSLQYQARFENERRWLTYDLLCGKVDEKHKLWKYFKKWDIDAETVLFFKKNVCMPQIFGFNYYVTSERFLDDRTELYPKHRIGGNKRDRYADIEVARVRIEEETGIKVLLKEAWTRYRQPIVVTEVHLHCHREEQLRWFKYVYDAASELRQEGVDIKAITSWAILGSFGWDQLLTKPKGAYEPGAFDIRSGHPRPTALATYIREKNTAPKSEHLLTQQPGWWHRESRLLIRSSLPQALKEDTGHRPRPILIVGRRGTLGRAFARVCTSRAIPFVLVSRIECDISQPHLIEEAIEKYQPWAIVNAAGYVRVDDAEQDPEACFRDNSIAAYNLAAACQRHGLQLVTISSDLVFDGKKGTPYFESDSTGPLNVYGKSKEQSEEHVLLANPSALVIRTSAFFGPWDNYNFLHWVEQSLEANQEVPVANDVYISPTYVPDLVNAALDLLIDAERGIWHLANTGAITWADLAYRVAKKMQLNSVLIKAIPSSHLHLPAPRPLYTVLGSEKGSMMPTLENAFDRYFGEKQRHNALVAEGNS